MLIIVVIQAYAHLAKSSSCIDGIFSEEMQIDKNSTIHQVEEQS